MHKETPTPQLPIPNSPSFAHHLNTQLHSTMCQPDDSSPPQPEEQTTQTNPPRHAMKQDETDGNLTSPRTRGNLNVVSIGGHDYHLNGLQMNEEFMNDFSNMSDEALVEKWKLTRFESEQDSEK